MYISKVERSYTQYITLQKHVHSPYKPHLFTTMIISNKLKEFTEIRYSYFAHFLGQYLRYVGALKVTFLYIHVPKDHKVMYSVNSDEIILHQKKDILNKHLKHPTKSPHI